MRKSVWLEKSNNNENNLEKNKKEIIKQEEENTKEIKKEVDICIIGAGITGITCGYELSKLGYTVSIIEKNEIGSGITGRTTGKITSQHDSFYNYLEESFDIDTAKKYLEANENAINKIEDRIKNENIECDFERLNSYIYTTKKEEINLIEKEFKTLKKLKYECEYITNLDLPFKIAGGICFKNQAQFHPIKYINGLAKYLKENGNKIYTHTIAKEIKKSDDKYIVKTDKFSISASYIIIASHYPFLKIKGLYSAKMYQSMSYLIAIETKKQLPNGMYISVSNPKITIRRAKYNEKNVLLIGGGGNKTGKEVTYEETYGRLEKFAREYYPDAKILAKWNAQDCVTLDKLPYIGQASKLLPKVYVATGFKKWGMTLSSVAVDIIVDDIRGRENEYKDIFLSSRMQPIKNHEEMKNMLVDSSKALVINKLKEKDIVEKRVKKETGGIIEIDGRKIGIYKDEKGEIYAVNPKCTHLGCLLVWNQVEKTWDCPCHGSRFDYKGKNIIEPAYDDLDIIDISKL